MNRFIYTKEDKYNWGSITWTKNGVNLKIIIAKKLYNGDNYLMCFRGTFKKVVENLTKRQTQNIFKKLMFILNE